MTKKKFNYANTPLPPELRLHAPFSGFIVVKLNDKYAYFDETDILNAIQSSQRNRLLSLFKEMRPNRLISNISIKELRAIEQLAAKSKFPPLRSLSTYWVLNYRNTVHSLTKTMAYLNGFEEIDIAYRELLTYDSDETTTPNYYYRQEYVKQAIKGIDAEWAWSKGIEGQGIGLIDLEKGWDLPHQELPQLYEAQNQIPIVNDNAHDPNYRYNNGYPGFHGTNVVSVIVAKDDSIGIKGIAPKTEYVKLASHYSTARQQVGLVSEAIIAIIKKLIDGTLKNRDVLLIEFQKLYEINDEIIKLPAETELAIFDAIRLASALGFTVIEAGGNGGKNLDRYTHPDISMPIDEDSGAIMVGAGAMQENGMYSRILLSNFGSRIDCFAPVYTSSGDDTFIVAGGIGNNPGDTNDIDGSYNNYSDDFGNTSLASAIIAGAAILLKSACLNLSPSQVRYLLSNPNTGVKDANNEIGVMPNLKAIIEDSGCLHNMPDVYIRRHIEDDGTIPFSASINASPDIIIRRTVIDTFEEFGEGSGRENMTNLNSIIRSGEDHFICVRMKNRGSRSTNAKVDIYYWAINKSIFSLSSWKLIGTSITLNIPENNDLVVTNFIKWSGHTIPSRKGDYYIIAIIRQEECDNLVLPLKAVNNESNFEELLSSEHVFEQFIRNNNNLACLKFSL